jgi:hypothetical protein
MRTVVIIMAFILALEHNSAVMLFVFLAVFMRD